LTLAKASRKPDTIVYVSCHAQTLIKDGMNLMELGYQLRHIEGVDQFPNTPHCEWVTLWTK
jgi:23S rRNA (uracil1939-C5)-methyltransferase